MRIVNKTINKKIPNESRNGRVGWQAPSNIAIVKYWGKRAGQLPMNPSLSFSLKQSVTQTTVNYNFEPGNIAQELRFRLGSTKRDDFASRIRKYIHLLLPHQPLFEFVSLDIQSHNTFPHSSGIASSASAFAALAIALVQIEEELKEKEFPTEERIRRASFFSRLGSGSACRSVAGAWNLWGETRHYSQASDTYAVQLNDQVHDSFLSISDSILILDDGAKKVSSSVGHALMEKNPYAKQRFIQANNKLGELLTILQAGDWQAFINLAEYEALALHAMMLTSVPGYILLKPESLQAIEYIREYRRTSALPVGFTIDAGANIHVLYPSGYRNKVLNELIEPALTPLCVDGRVIHDSIGAGPKKLELHE